MSRTGKIVFEGDSNTSGYGLTGAGTVGGYTYPRHVLDRLGGGWIGSNQGTAGDLWADVLGDAATVDALLDGTKDYNVIVVMCGINDIAGGRTPAQILADVASYCAARQAAGWLVVVCGVLPAGTVSGADETDRLAVNAGIAAAWSGYADAYVALENSDIGDKGDELTAFYQADNVHLSTTGTPAMAALVYAQIKSLIGGDYINLKDSLVEVWEMDAASGNETGAHAGIVMTETSGTIDSAAGKIGTARDFEAGDTEYFESADSTSLSTGSSPLTISCWVKLESTGSYPVIAQKGWKNTPDANSEWLFYFDHTLSRFVFAVHPASGADGVVRSVNGITTGTWYHVVAQHDPDNDYLSIRVNAGAPDTAAHSLGGSDGTAAMQIGASSVQSLWWDGLIDQFAIAKRIWSLAEIERVYASGNGRAYSAWAIAPGGNGLAIGMGIGIGL